VWYGVDPLWEKYPAYNPYNYCKGNPITKVDLNGKNDYEINEKGYLVREIQNRDKSRFFIVDNKGNRIKSLSFDVNIVQYSGTLNYRRLAPQSRKIIAVVKYDLYQIYGEENGKKLFEFLAENTNVEWGKITYGPKEHKDCFIANSHRYDAEEGIPSFLSNKKIKIINYGIVPILTLILSAHFRLE